MSEARHIETYKSKIMNPLEAWNTGLPNWSPNILTNGCNIVEHDDVRRYLLQELIENPYIGWIGEIAEMPDRFLRKRMRLAQPKGPRKYPLVKPDLSSLVKMVRQIFVQARAKICSLASRSEEMHFVAAIGQPARQAHCSVFNATKITDDGMYA